MATVPILMQKRQSCITTISEPFTPHIVAQISAGPAVELESSLSNYSSTLTTLRSQHWTSPNLEWLGIYKSRSVTYIRHDIGRRQKSKHIMEDAISETREVLISWSFLRLRLHWDRKYPYGSFGRSPSIYPVVKSIHQYFYLIEEASIQDIQQMISSGALHPYVTDEDGQSLLHVSEQSQTIQKHS
jgi:hypothetical protein